MSYTCVVVRDHVINTLVSEHCWNQRWTCILLVVGHCLSDMNPATPKKLVHWDTDSPSLSNFGSPFLNGTYDSSVDATSSFDFINSQLVAHGYIAPPGVSLAGISNEDSMRLAKCLLAMLSQRTVCNLPLYDEGLCLIETCRMICHEPKISPRNYVHFHTTTNV